MDVNYISTAPITTLGRFSLPVSIILLLIITCAIYWPGLAGSFTLDDTHTLRLLNKMGGLTSLTNLGHFVSDGVGNIGRPLAMLFLAIDDQYFPGDPAKYRYTNLMIHLLCGLFLLLFMLKILRATNMERSQTKIVAFLVFSFWLLHPLNVSTTLYVVQRTAQAMTLFTLMGVTCYAYGRYLLHSKLSTGTALITTSVLLFGILATLCKENGILICLYILALEYTVFQRLYRPTWFKYWLGLFSFAPLLFLALYLAYRFPSYIDAYSVRDFTMLERVLTEFRILVTYLYQIVIPPSSKTGLFHDDYLISSSLVSPLTTIFSIIFVIALIILAIRLRKKQPVFSLAVLWYFGGHILESTFIPLELYFEHRNYLPMVGPLLGIVYYCYIYASRLNSKVAAHLARAVPIFLVIISSLFTYQSATIWGSPELMYRIWYKEHPNSLRAATMYAQMFEKYGNYSKASALLETAYKKHPDTVALLLYNLKLSCQSNTPTKYSIADITKASEQGTYRYALPMVARQLVQTVKSTNCRYVTIDDLISILIALEDVKRLRGSAKVELLFLLSDLYISKGMLSPAIEALDRAFKTQQLPTIAARQAELLSSAGLYKDALRYIEIAKRADSKKRLFEPSDMHVIRHMETKIRKQINQLPLSSQ